MGRGGVRSLGLAEIGLWLRGLAPLGEGALRRGFSEPVIPLPVGSGRALGLGSCSGLAWDRRPGLGDIRLGATHLWLKHSDAGLAYLLCRSLDR